MDANGNLGWDDALSGGKYVKFEDGIPKTIVLTNWRFEKKISRDNPSEEPKIAFVADIIEEDGEAVKGKILDTTSIRLKLKLRTVLEKKQPTEKVTLAITKVGDKKETAFSVRELVGGNSSSPKPISPENQVKINSLKEMLDSGSLTQEGYNLAVSNLI